MKQSHSIMKGPISNQQIFNWVQLFSDQPISSKPSTIWPSYLLSGSHLWMDTGDIEQAKLLWTTEFSALTTNNTLLNKEVQSGIYDKILLSISKEINALDDVEKVTEIAFIINAIHGLRLVKIFNCKVSVELDTAIAQDIQSTVEVGERLFRICPENFIIKVPYTPEGLIAARQLHDKGIPVNMTLGFSLRQNVFASLITKAAYCNVFLGRIGAYFSSNDLGSGINIGEKVTRETQKCIRKIKTQDYAKTKLIAASIRSGEQLAKILGTNTFTIPISAANEVITKKLMADKSYHHSGLTPEFNADKINIEYIQHLWEIQEHEKQTALHLSHKLPSTAQELIEYANENGCHEMFPTLNNDELNTIAHDGKIPVHDTWKSKIESYQIGIDTLLNYAGLYAFKKDQSALNQRIKDII